MGKTGRLDVVTFVVLILFAGVTASGYSGVFRVKYKYAGVEHSLNDLKEHDNLRQLRFLGSIDLPLGGSGRPDGLGLYYAKIGIGTPSKNYYVHVDTGSDIMWVNCIQCKDCPKKSALGIDLSLYDMKESATGKLIPCNDEFCYSVNSGSVRGCSANMSCPYFEVYRDGSLVMGYFVEDLVQYDKVSGDLETASGNGSAIFGCGVKQLGYVDSSNEMALDGILGFGKSNTSMISQLAATGKVKQMFAHCLDSRNGGGIFAMGHVVQPKVNTTPLIFGQPHYTVNMTAVQVAEKFLHISTNVSDRGGILTIIDSGTTLAYLPEMIYEPLVHDIISHQPDLRVQTVKDAYTCFEYSKSIDDGFPNVTFHFQDSIYLNVYPHDYLFQFDDLWCIGWQNSGLQSRDGWNITLLGDLVLSNKLVLYDLQYEGIGWIEYNCSSTIEVQDEQTGVVHYVGSHYLSAATVLSFQCAPPLVVFLMLICHTLFFGHVILAGNLEDKCT